VSRQPSKKPKPNLSPTLFVANKQRAAIGQLESAILLWFNEADPISIHVLASHAHDCYHALGDKIGKPSWHGKFVEGLSDPNKLRMRYIQDFAKHGFMDLDESAEFDTIFADAMIFISIDCHMQIFGHPMRPLMMLYWARLFREHPDWTPELQSLSQVLIDSGIIDDAAKGSRKQCFESLYPLLKLASPPLPPL
jgi:hypothetical protein